MDCGKQLRRVVLSKYSFNQAYAFTADAVRKCLFCKQKSMCEANLRWISVCNYEGTEQLQLEG